MGGGEKYPPKSNVIDAADRFTRQGASGKFDELATASGTRYATAARWISRLPTVEKRDGAAERVIQLLGDNPKATFGEIRDAVTPIEYNI